MRCPKCGYTSFDYYDTCTRCGGDLQETRKDGGIASQPITLPSPKPPFHPTSEKTPASNHPARVGPPLTASPRGEGVREDLPLAPDPLIRPRAGFWIRLLAHFLDELIFNFTVLIFLLMAFLAIGGGVAFSGNQVGWEAIMEPPYYYLLVAMSLILTIAYYVGFVGWRGQTPGKILLGLKIVQTSGTQMTYGRAFLRWLGQLVSSLTLGIGYLMIAFSRQKQGLHDLIASTYVIKLR